jgi:ATP-dependent helicase/nuclease subunit B
MNLATIPPDAPFLNLVAARWLAEAGDEPLAAARGIILLPTRRAARALADAFLRASGGRPLLLPRIVALGALDESPLALAGALDLPPAVAPAQRLAALARMIVALRGRDGAPTSADGAWRLARALGELMDEVERAEIDLAAQLPDAADAAFAAHWQTTLRFLEIVTAHWPAWLAEHGLMNPAARQVALLDRQARHWAESPPAEPVWAAGSTATIPAVARLLRCVAQLPTGLAILPGLDLAMPEAVWAMLEETHPQAGLERLLRAMGASRRDVGVWPGTEAVSAAPRRALLQRALLPAAAIDRWRHEPAPPADRTLYRLSPADEQEEALAIALILREAIETPGRTAALVTPDRTLACRVAAELGRFGVVADDSAGEKMAEAPPGVFLRLLAAASAAAFAPVELLSVLKHPLAAVGLAPSACRAATRALEQAALRGQRPAPTLGLGGIRKRFEQASETVRTGSAADLLDRLERALAPLFRATAAVLSPPVALLTALLESAEALATSDAASGAARLWSGEDGEALALLLADALDSLPALPDQRPRVLPGLLDALLEGAVVRTRRALRGRDGAEHPRIFIWGLIEARLQSVDTVVLGGLAESVWPPATEPGPWLSRPMRRRVGLASPAEAIGQAAHDFVGAACAAPVAILSCPRRRAGAPAVPARWLERLDACLDTPLRQHPAVEWARGLDQPIGRPIPAAPPRPCPPATARPRRLSVTDVETWIKDPYAIYARHVLKLRRLDPLDEATEHAEFGNIVHAALHRFIAAHGTDWPLDAADSLRTLLRQQLGKAGLRKALVAWWQPRLDRIAEWLAAAEAERRAAGPPQAIGAEVGGVWTLARRGGPFELVGRADRIERWADGRLAILDYKTGSVPTGKDVRSGRAPQLPLEAKMAAAGAFGLEFEGETATLIYVSLKGGREPGSLTAIDLATIDRAAADGLAQLIDAYDDPARCYLALPVPSMTPRFAAYTQLARVAEWAVVETE